MKVLGLGGTGVSSRDIVKKLIQTDHEVTLYNRGQRNLPFSGEVRQINGDRNDRATFESSMREERFDAVIDMICFNEADARSTVAAFGESGAHIVICSSVRGIVCSTLGREYTGVELQEEQVNANRKQWDEIVAFEPGQLRPDNIVDLTPAEKVGEYWLKRDDQFCVGGVQGGKVRTCWKLAQGAKGLVTAGSISSLSMRRRDSRLRTQTSSPGS